MIEIKLSDKFTRVDVQAARADHMCVKRLLRVI